MTMTLCRRRRLPPLLLCPTLTTSPPFPTHLPSSPSDSATPTTSLAGHLHQLQRIRRRPASKQATPSLPNWKLMEERKSIHVLFIAFEWREMERD
ncbi:unnamed protein product [Linum trigynum]|uniref:Secreted protein n=1 Tax=Linum trigynum TaxID=586398 RepID=A0AAV2GK62_9ROSI